MSRVLERVTHLLHALAAEPSSELGTLELARRCRLSPATCARLLADLRRLGWADQHHARAGWRLGPLAHSLARRAPYRASAVIERLRPQLLAIAARHDVGISISCLRGERRISLLHLGRVGRPIVNALNQSDDVWQTAGGRLLVALLPPRQRARLIERLGLPGIAWPGVLTRRELDTELRRIAREQRCQRGSTESPSVAVPLGDGQGGWLSLGAWQPPSAPIRRLEAVGRALSVLAQGAELRLN